MMAALKRLPIAVRLPALVGLLILLVSVGTSQIAINAMSRTQDQQIERMAAIYLDGLAATVLPYASARDPVATDAALGRAISFAEGIRERQALVRTPDGTVLAWRRGEGLRGATEAPSAIGSRWSPDGGTVWVQRELKMGSTLVATVSAELDVSGVVEERERLRLNLVAGDLVLSTLLSLGGFFLMRRLLQPVQTLTDHLRMAAGDRLAPVPDTALPPRQTEFGELLRNFNTMVEAVAVREDLADRLASQERAAGLGRLAATMAHEVRNPVAGMMNAVETAHRFADRPEVVRESMALIERGLGSIESVVAAALSTYRPSEDRRPLTSDDLADLRALVTPEARRREIGLRWDVDLPEPFPVDADRTRQILLNLLLNACAVTPRNGHVALTARRVDEELMLSVEDGGPGMTGETASRFNGTDQGSRQPGLGIEVVVRLLRTLQGEIAVASEPGRGSRVEIRLPPTPVEQREVAT